MADTDQSINNLRYNQVTQGLEGFGGGSPSWTPLALTAEATTPAGSPHDIQFNGGGVFAATDSLLWDGSSLQVAGNVELSTGDVKVDSGDIVLTDNNKLILGRSGAANILFSINKFIMQTDNSGNAELGSIGEIFLCSDATNTQLPAIDLQSPSEGGNIELMSISGVSIADTAFQAPDPSAFLDVQSSSKGILFPRLTTTQKNAIASPAEGLVVYDLTLHKLSLFTGSIWETVTSS